VAENKRRRTGKKLYVLFDAMYGCLTSGDNYNYNPLQLNEEIRPYLVTINAVSKIFAGTGMRVGWCLGQVEILSKMRNLLTHMGAWAPMAEQKATARFLSQPQAVIAYLRKFREDIQARLEAIYTGFRQLKLKGNPVSAIKPQGGIYLSVQFSLLGKTDHQKELESAADIAQYLLNESGFAILPFSVFGSSEDLQWFRISVGTCRKADIPVMLRKLEVALHPFQFNKIKEVTE